MGYHGTSKAAAESIVRSAFTFFPGPEDWLGNGVYFFVDGISCPEKNAFEWASNKFQKDACAVVRTEIVAPADKVLDLTCAAGLARYDEARMEFVIRNKDGLAKRRDLSKKKRKDIRLDDKIVTEAVLESLGATVLIHNVYIKNALQRELILESSYPNATACSVSDMSLLRNSKIKPVHCDWRTNYAYRMKGLPLQATCPVADSKFNQAINLS